MMRRTSVVVAVVLALSSCSATSGRSPGGERPEPTSTKTTEPEPTGPCASGTCELEVTVGDVVNVPRKYGLGPIEVTAIADGAVEMTAPVTGSGYSMSGCSGGGGVSSSGGGGIGMSCEAGVVATINDVMRLTVVRILATTAVLRIEPAG
jgi:hypothetical protein